MAIDRRYRDRLADGIAAFMRREIDSSGFDEILSSSSSRDAGAEDASKHLWLFYDDLSVHHISVSRETWDQLRRWYAFLKTDYGLTRRSFSLERWLMPWILLAAFVVGAAVLVPKNIWVIAFLWSGLGIALYGSYWRRLARDRRFLANHREFTRLSSCAPFLLAEDWQRHECLVASADLPSYDPSIHAKPIRSRAGELVMKAWTLGGCIFGFPIVAVLLHIIRESRADIFLRTPDP